jgi:CubicO group peptidase (beta-lactamase class C family)
MPAPARRCSPTALASGLAAGWLAVAALTPVRASLAQPAADRPFAAAEAAIRAEMQKAGIPGAAVAVIVGDRVAWTRGFGIAHAETGAPVTPDTLFQIGSVTKPFTAAAILAAAAEGALRLDLPLSTYVKGLAACVGAPTLTQLLSHTGGLIDEPDEFGPQGEEELGAYQRTWTSEYCLLPPGRTFSYSNSGFALAGLALQEVDQKPFGDVMKTRVLAPLGMTRTTFRPTEAMTWPLAVGHRKDKNGRFEVVRPLANDARLWPAGTLYSSANEMARFAMALLNDGKVAGKQALPAGVAAKMRTASVQIPTTGEHYGQGMFLNPEGAGHGGSMTGYVAQYSIDPDSHVAVVVLTNGDNVNPQPLLEAARRDARVVALLQLGAASGRGVFSDSSVPAPMTPRQADAYVGRYSNPRRFTVEVTRTGTALTLKRFGREFPMRATATAGLFKVDLPRGGTETVAFGLGPDGRADYLQMNVWALARVPAL